MPVTARPQPVPMLGEEIVARLALLLVISCLMAAPRSAIAEEAQDRTGRPAGLALVHVVRLQGSINPGAAELLRRALEEAVAAEAACLVVELDTPGGLLATLRSMVQDVMASQVPVVVYVTPSGAQAASAGAILCLAAHVAAMAPGTNIGAAHPVGIGGKGEKDETMATKAENDVAAMARSVAAERGRNADWAERAVRESVSASVGEALELGVIEIVARDRSDLLRQLHGRTVALPDGPRTLELGTIQVVDVGEGVRERILRTIADPNIAYILMMIGVTGLYFELAHPGTIFPGTIGAICLLLGLFALQTLPVSITGLLLLLLAVVLFVLELLITSNGLLGTAGLVSLALGSIFLFDTPATGITIAAGVLWTTLLGVGIFLMTITYLATKAAVSPPHSGAEALVGEHGTTREDIGPHGGRVFVHGELWTAASDKPIPEGTEIRVVSVEGMRLRVAPAREPR